MNAHTARGVGPASNRSDLFISARKTERTHTNLDERDNNAETYLEKINDDDQNPLQIEHTIGYAGDYRQTVLAAVSDQNIYIKSLGSLVLVENLSDPHDQKLLRGHDMEVSTF
jgi:hypothetical protein